MLEMKKTSPNMFSSKISSGNSNLPKSFLQKQQSFPSEYKNVEKVTSFSAKKLLIIFVFRTRRIQSCHLSQKVLADVKFFSVQTPKIFFLILFEELILRKCPLDTLKVVLTNFRKFFCEKSTKFSFKLRNVRNANFLYCVPFFQNNPTATQKTVPTTISMKILLKNLEISPRFAKTKATSKLFKKVFFSKWFPGHAKCKFVNPDRKFSPTSKNSLKSEISFFFS